MTPNQIVQVIKDEGVHLEDLPNGSILARIGGGEGLLYENAIVLVPVGGKVYEAKGLVKLPSLVQRRKLRDAMKAKGFTMKLTRVRRCGELGKK